MNIPGADARKKRKLDVRVEEPDSELAQFRAWSDASVQRELDRDAAIQRRQDERDAATQRRDDDLFQQRMKSDQDIAAGIYSKSYL
jgi:hypothetical protein